MISGGVFGPKLCGKTTLTRELSREQWNVHARPSLILDPHLEEWGPHAWVTNDDATMWDAVWKSSDCLVIVEEAATTINRQRDLMQVFTRMRHNRHKLLVVGHSGSDLLPGMRSQLDTLYLFKQPLKPAKDWCELFADPDIMECTKLQQYEFLDVQSFRKPVKRRLTL